jgi:hypothetical protein
MMPLSQSDPDLDYSGSWADASKGWPSIDFPTEEQAREAYVAAWRDVKVPYGSYVLVGTVLRLETEELKLRVEAELQSRGMGESPTRGAAMNSLIDAAVMARLRAPFGCEFIPGTTPDHRGRWRIHDANDDAIASVAPAEEGYARLIVEALNTYFEVRRMTTTLRVALRQVPKPTEADEAASGSARASGCKPFWAEGIVGWAYHCSCDDGRHGRDQQCSALPRKDG